MWQSFQHLLKQLVSQACRPKALPLAEAMGAIVITALASIITLSAQAFHAAFHIDAIVVLITQAGISLLMVVLTLSCVLAVGMILYWFWLKIRLYGAQLNRRRRKAEKLLEEKRQRHPTQINKKRRQCP